MNPHDWRVRSNARGTRPQPPFSPQAIRALAQILVEWHAQQIAKAKRKHP